jgi:hypothetical protein
MKDVTAEAARSLVQKKNTDRRVAGETTTLDQRYGRIGISAVAAAVRYQGSSKNPAYAPAPSQWRDQIAGEAA